MKQPWTLESDGHYTILTAYCGNEEHVTIPDTVQIIGRHAFLKCRSLRSLTIPASVTCIQTEAFHCCDHLQKLKLSKGLSEIQSRAFWYCSALTDVTFPATVQLIGSRAFECCSSLKDITLLNPAASVDEYAFNETPYWNRLLREAARCAAGADMRQCPKQLILPEGITHIDGWSYSKSAIASAWLPNSLRTMGMCAFKDCTSLKSVSMSPNTYCNSHIQTGPVDGIFSGCSQLEEITFRGPLKNFTWYDASRPQLLRGFHPEKTFIGCNRLRRMTAWEILLTDFPAPWQRFAVQGYLHDIDRRRHYRADVSQSYDVHLRSIKASLIRRTASDHSYALHQYLMEQRLITEDNYEQIFQQAAEHGSPEVTSALLTYKNHFLRTSSPGSALLHGLKELEL